MHTLLIADSDSEARERLRTLLPWRSYGFEVIAEADSCASALEQALNLRPSAAFLPLCLNGRRGADLVRQLQAAGLKTAFCIVSDSAEPDDIRSAMRAGARDFLVRPLDAGEVRAFLERSVPGMADGAVRDAVPELPGTDPVLRVSCECFSPLTNRILIMVRDSVERSSGITLTSVAEELHMNSKYLGRVFFRDTGMKFSDYLTACRMERARQLICGTQEKISVIALRVGYRYINRFYVHFRAYFGISPGELRNPQRPQRLTGAGLS